MRASEKDRLAAEVADRRVDFETALSDKRKYPVQQFRQFWEVGRRYAELTKRDPLRVRQNGAHDGSRPRILPAV